MHLCKCQECMGWLLGWLLCRGLPGLIKLASLWEMRLFSYVSRKNRCRGGERSSAEHNRGC